MPYKPKKPCSFPGCPRLTEDRFCDVHRNSEAKQPTGSRNSFYSSSEWKIARKEYLLEHPVCIFCGKPATIVDHIIPIKDGGAPLDGRNFQPLCWGCHSRKSVEDGSRFRKKVYTY